MGMVGRGLGDGVCVVVQYLCVDLYAGLFVDMDGDCYGSYG